jgi:hypothetical protein
MSQQPEQHSTPFDVAKEVRGFYDRYPYPQPTESLDKYGRLWQDLQRRLAEYHVFWPAGTHRGDLSILIAGCGTSEAAQDAIDWTCSIGDITQRILPS